MPTLEIRGAGIHHELACPAGGGDRAGAVVLLNGIAMSAGNWKPFVEDLSRDRRVLCHDFRGQTLSGRPEGGYSLRGHAEDLAALMRHLGIARAHVVGTSYGGEVALEFALAFPGMTDSLVVIDAASWADPMLRAAVEGWKAAALADPVAFYRSIVAWNYSAGYIGANAEAIARREAAVATLPRDWFEAFAALCDAFLAIDLRGRLGPIAAPTLVMYGERDILKGESYARDIAGEIPRAALAMIPGAGHAAVIERPAECLAAIRAHLAGPGSRT